jgi:hypothetical protein
MESGLIYQRKQEQEAWILLLSARSIVFKFPLPKTVLVHGAWWSLWWRWWVQYSYSNTRMGVLIMLFSLLFSFVSCSLASTLFYSEYDVYFFCGIPTCSSLLRVLSISSRSKSAEARLKTADGCVLYWRWSFQEKPDSIYEWREYL